MKLLRHICIGDGSTGRTGFPEGFDSFIIININGGDEMKKTRAAILLCAMLVILALLVGCGGSGSSKAEDMVESPSEMYDYNSGAGLNYDEEAAPPVPAPQAGKNDGAVSGGGVGSTATISQKLIYTLDLSIETLDYEASIRSIEELTKEYGGYIEYANVDNNRIRENDLRTASFTLRIPAESLDDFEKSCGNIGGIFNRSRRTENATAAYIDLTARLENYRVEEETLRQLLTQAKDIDTIIALNTRLTEVRYQIESIESSLRNIDSLVSYSTVNIHLYEVIKPTAVEDDVPRTFGERVSARMKNTRERFVNEMERIGIYVFGELPLALLLFIIKLIPIIVIVVIILLIWRAVRRKRQLKNGQDAKPAIWERRPADSRGSGPKDNSNTSKPDDEKK
ncbi:MAG TPA: DUF4349 domain-containing protein [Clostridiales bacterium]|nr:DUF4349 domain-containing protein [Clostridiales bacterium]